MKQGIVGGAIGAAVTLVAVAAGAALVGKAEAQDPVCRVISAQNSSAFEGYVNRMVGQGYAVRAAGSEQDGSMWAIVCR